VINPRFDALLLAVILLLVGPTDRLHAQDATAGDATATTAATTAPTAKRKTQDNRPDVLGAATLNSPQAAMFEFLAAMGEIEKGRDASWQAALSTLDLSLVEEGKERAVAEQLHTVLDQLGEVRREDLPDPANVEKLGITRYQFFPRVDVHGWVWKAIGGPPGGKIVLEKVGTGPAAKWKFSARTCAEMGALSASLAKLPPLYTPNENQVIESVMPTIQRTDLMGWLRLTSSVLLALVVGKLAQLLLRVLARRGAARGWQIEPLVLRSVATPLFLLVVNVGMTVGATMIFLEQSLAFYVFTAVKLFFIVNICWLLYNLVDVLDLILRRITARTESTLDDMLVPMLRKGFRIFLVAIFMLIIARTIFGLDITGWLAGFGIAGLAVSLAAQDSIKNLFGSVTVFCDNPFSVGDHVIFGTYDCVIEEIGFRSTRVRTLEGSIVTIPNAKFIDGVVENVSARTSLRRQLAISIPQKTGAEKTQTMINAIQHVLNQTGVAEAIDHEKAPPRVAASEVAGDRVTVRVQYWYTLRDGRDTWTFQTHCQEVNLALVEELTRLGVEFVMV
jgi:MscS family membrane protein